MPVIAVAIEYIRIHREDSSDEEIERALREQGFSNEILAEAFCLAGERRAPPRPPARRALVRALAAASALLFIGSAFLFVRNLRQASRAAASPR